MLSFLAITEAVKGLVEERYPGTVSYTHLCYIELDGAADAYEVSLLPVPAQPAAGVVKRYGGPDGPEESPPGGAPGEDSRNWQDDALLELEKNRYYGGNQA